MTTQELETIRLEAWHNFLLTFEQAGLSRNKLYQAFNHKNCYALVSEATLVAYSEDLENNNDYT